jgi:hypothetical protein
METPTADGNPAVSPIRKAIRIGCGCLLVFFGLVLFLPMLLIGYRDRERQRACDEALGGMVIQRVTASSTEANGGAPLTLETLRTDETWINWSSYAGDIAAHINGGGQARLVWTGGDTIGVLLFDRDGKAVRHVCFVT